MRWLCVDTYLSPVQMDRLTLISEGAPVIHAMLVAAISPRLKQKTLKHLHVVESPQLTCFVRSKASQGSL